MLPYEGDLRPPNDAETRARYLMAAQALCDRLRERYGTCVLRRVDFNMRELWITDLEALPPGTNPERIEAFVSLTVFADRSTLDMDQLLQAAREIIAEG